MPRLGWIHQMAGNDTYYPLDAWEFRRVPQGYVNGAIVKIHQNQTIANTVVSQVKTGSQLIQPETPVTLAAALGNMPNDYTSLPLVFKAAAGDELGLAVRETAGGVPYVQGYIDIEPV